MKETFICENPEMTDKVQKEHERIIELGKQRTNVCVERDVACDIFNCPDLSNVQVDIEERSDKKYFTISRYVIYKDGNLLCDVWRNYDPYPHAFIKHKNGNLYFICGFDYQGVTLVNITKEEIYHYLPASAEHGFGWCMVDVVDYDEEDDELTLDGCIWGMPYERIRYDFSDPEKMQWPTLGGRWLDEEYADDEEDNEEDNGE